MIYFIRGIDGGNIKIGHSKDPCKRLKQLQPSSPSQLRIITTIRGGQFEESKIHTDLKKYQDHNEWFEDDPIVFKYMIESLIKDIETYPEEEKILLSCNQCEHYTLSKNKKGIGFCKKNNTITNSADICPDLLDDEDDDKDFDLDWD